jgi:predicted transport protein
MSIVVNSSRLLEYEYKNEKDFEIDISENSKYLFGDKTIYINSKKKVEAKTLGGAIPDGFFFDFSDSSDPQFYIVEVELSKHDFFSHIFPQITKFFAFFKNTKMRSTLVEKLYDIIENDISIKSQFLNILGKRELYKFIYDLLANSQNILLVIDSHKEELPEIMDTYFDTWGKLVKVMEVKKYRSGNKEAFSVHPDLENIQLIDETDLDKASEQSSYTEDYHLENALPETKSIYKQIKVIAKKLKPDIVFNSKKYYISIKSLSNIVFMNIRKKKIVFIAMMPLSPIKSIVKHYSITLLSKPVQDFYNGSCAAININNEKYLNEIAKIIKELLRRESPR